MMAERHDQKARLGLSRTDLEQTTDGILRDDCRVGAGECVGRPIEHVDRFAHGRSRRAAEEFARVLVIFGSGLGLGFWNVPLL